MNYILEGFYYFYNLAMGFLNLTVYDISILTLLQASVCVAIIGFVFGFKVNIVPKHEDNDKER